MKAALLIVLSLAALAYAGPAKQQHMTASSVDSSYSANNADWKSTQATDILKHWCYSSQMSQAELTSSFKKLVSVVKSSPEDSSTEAAVMSERICQGASQTSKTNTDSSNTNTVSAKSSPSSSAADAQAHELIKDVYMDSLIACDSRECMKQLVKIINSNKVDTIRASYYMTRIAVTESDQINDDRDVQELADSFVANPSSSSDAIERQKLFAVTSLIGKSIKNKSDQQANNELKQTADKVVKTIVDRYINQVSSQEVAQYQQQSPKQQSADVANKISKRNAALKALANIPGYVIKETTSSDAEQVVMKIAQDKDEMVTARQSAIECLEQNESALQTLKQIAFDQEEPIEVRVAALRAAMTTLYAGKKNDSSKHQQASELVDQVVKHCEDQRNQDSDDQFVLYAVSYLDNMRTSSQPEHDAIKQVIAKNKQHYMQIQVLNKKFKQELSNVRKSSRNYKLEQEFNQIESGLVIEGDLVYDSKKSSNQYNAKNSASSTGGAQILPKVVRFNMSMPVMGKTVNVVEVTVRQNQMDDELFGALKLVKDAKFNSDSMSKVVDSFKSSVDQSRKNSNNNNNKQSAEADLSIKVDGCTVVYVSVDDFKSSSSSYSSQHQRNARAAYSIVDEVIEHLKRKPVAFNRGFNFNINERLAKVLDVDANIIAGLRFMSRASGSSSSDFEIVANVEPRFAFEAIVGPAKMSSKKLLQRVSTKTALGMRLKFKSDELVDVQIDLPLENMELFTVETQMVEKSSKVPNSYSYLPESIYGQEDIYAIDEMYNNNNNNYYNKQQMLDTDDLDNNYGDRTTSYSRNVRRVRNAIFSNKKSSSPSAAAKSLANWMSDKSSFAHSFESSESVARATGLRSKLRLVASPKDLTFLVQAFVQKYEPSMQGYRVQVQKSGRQADQYVFTVSTPGSRYDRTMQARVVMQQTASRAHLKTELQTPNMGAVAQYELIYDGRTYAVKAEIASTRGKQWRHAFEAGVASSPSSRLATTYKPYLSIQSSSLKRPVQMQGVVSYQQSPKTVISYELKCPTTGDFVQGKFIADARTPAYLSKRSIRSMQSPLEIVLNKDITLTGELVAQIEKHAVKAHQMIDWDASKWALNADYVASHKNLRKSVETQASAQLKLNADQQAMTVQRKSAQDPRKDFRLTLVSDSKLSSAHQMTAELRYNSKRSSNAIAAYKHKLDFSNSKSSNNKIDFAYDIELISSAHHVNEKINGRTLIALDRNMKTLRTNMNTRRGQVKLDFDYASLSKHNLQVLYSGAQYRHEASVRADNRVFSLRSTTDKRGQFLAKMVLEVLKQQGECQLLVEVPAKHAQVAADLKFASGKTSSWAVQTPRFSSKAEFSFDKMARSTLFSNKRNIPSWMKPIASFSPISNLRFKTDLKDSMNQEAYWIDSSYDSDADKSYFRLDSPVYRTDIEYDPRSSNTKFGAFARSKRSTDSYRQLYSSSDSILSQALDRNLNLGNKLWMLRSVIDLPLQKQARRVLFDYADKRQQHKHSFDYNPMNERFNFNLNRQPNTDYSSSSSDYVSPMRFTGDLAKSSPSSLSMSSDYLDFDFAAKPYDGEDSFATLSALSRHRRSPFKKHDSEIRYKKNAGYTASMKHQDAKDRRHSWQLEADESPKKWAKMSYDSDKHGKAKYEHNWRKYTTKRSSDADADYYNNYVSLSAESPKKNWAHSSSLNWQEPTRRYYNDRVRRSISDSSRYNTIDYLKHINARLNSQTSKNSADLYKLDFDYQPSAYQASLKFDMPEDDMLHSSVFEYEPTDRLYKLTSKLYNRHTNEPTYSFLASTKPYVSGLASADQEPVFIDQTHSMLARPITNKLAANLFKQPMKLDYSDKFGRALRFNYDNSPIPSNKYSGLRQERAAFYYKDDAMNFEHDSSYDFYPEAMLAGGFKPSSIKRNEGADYAIKANTKYGPVVVQADSDSNNAILKVNSPFLNAKLTAESSSHDAKRIKIELDNKSQTVQLSKIIRKNAPFLRDIDFVQKAAQKLDNNRFEHETEIIASIVNAIFKLKSQTAMNGRTVLDVTGEYNKQADKAYVKVNGERTKGQVIVDLVTKSANLVLDVDDKRTLQHQTRILPAGDKFFTVNSMTSYKQRPLFELSGKISSLAFNPSHLFSRRRLGANREEHISTFDAVLFEPKQIRITGQYDCLKKEARVIFKNAQDKKTQETTLKFDDSTETILVDSRLDASYGSIYSTKAKINLPSLVNPSKCYSSSSCTSDVIYSDNKYGSWAARYVPGDYISVKTPNGKQVINLAY